MDSKILTLIVLVIGLTSLALILPPNTSVEFFKLSVNAVPLFFFLDGSFLVALSFAIIGDLTRDRLHGRFGLFIRDIVGGVEQGFLVLVPLETIYIIVFATIAIQNSYVLDHFQLLFVPGLFGILLPFTWRFWAGIASSYYQLFDKYIFEPLKNRRKIHRPPVPGSRPRKFYLASAAVPTWAGIGYLVLDDLFRTTIASRVPDVSSMAVFSVSALTVVVVTAILLWTVSKYSKATP